jgi:hypothetical protein
LQIQLQLLAWGWLQEFLTETIMPSKIKTF